jgi:hypothetical protein
LKVVNLRLGLADFWKSTKAEFKEIKTLINESWQKWKIEQ